MLGSTSFIHSLNYTVANYYFLLSSLSYADQEAAAAQAEEGEDEDSNHHPEPVRKVSS